MLRDFFADFTVSLHEAAAADSRHSTNFLIHSSFMSTRSVHYDLHSISIVDIDKLEIFITVLPRRIFTTVSGTDFQGC